MFTECRLPWDFEFPFECLNFSLVCISSITQAIVISTQEVEVGGIKVPELFDVRTEHAVAEVKVSDGKKVDIPCFSVTTHVQSLAMGDICDCACCIYN